MFIFISKPNDKGSFGFVIILFQKVQIETKIPYDVCVCVHVYVHMRRYVLPTPLLNSLVYKIHGQLLPNNFNTIAPHWKPENEETDYRPDCNLITEQQKKEGTRESFKMAEE